MIIYRFEKQCGGPLMRPMILLIGLLLPFFAYADAPRQPMESTHAGEQLNIAKSWLESLRRSTTSVADVDFFERYLRKNHLAPEAVGTSREEIESFRSVAYQTHVVFLLKTLRRGTTRYKGAIAGIDAYLRKYGLSYSALGTSPEEIERLRVKGCKLSAIQWLEALRRGTVQSRAAYQNVLKFMFEGNLIPTDIGTSVEELKGFVQKMPMHEFVGPPCTTTTCKDANAGSKSPAQRAGLTLLLQS